MVNSELKIVNSLNHYFRKNGIEAIAYRIKQAKFTEQFCDILVDSKNPLYYLGIECKSINLNSSKKLYFSQHFHSNEREQIFKIDRFLKISGRRGYLALELRKGRGHFNELYFLPWNFVMQKFKTSGKIDFKEIEKNFVKVRRRNGLYQIKEIFPEQ